MCAFAYAQFNDEAQNSSPDLEVAESANPQYGYGGYGGRGGKIISSILIEYFIILLFCFDEVM